MFSHKNQSISQIFFCFWKEKVYDKYQNEICHINFHQDSQIFFYQTYLDMSHISDKINNTVLTVKVIGKNLKYVKTKYQLSE